MKTSRRRPLIRLLAPLLGLIAILALAAGPALARPWVGSASLRQALVGQVAGAVSVDEDADEGPGDEDANETEDDQGVDEDPGDQGADEDQGDQGADENDDNESSDENESGDSGDSSDSGEHDGGDSGGDD